jgi:hypothetical protein
VCRRKLAANRRLLELVTEGGDPGQEALDDFRRGQQALDREIKALQAQLVDLPVHRVDVAALAALRDRLTRTDVATVVADLQRQHDVAGLRDVLAATVQSAQIVERVGGGRNGKTSWVRAEVAWTSDVQLLLDHGYLELAPPTAAPMPPPTKLDRVRRWRARRRAERAAQAPEQPQDVLTLPQAAEKLGPQCGGHSGRSETTGVGLHASGAVAASDLHRA